MDPWESLDVDDSDLPSLLHLRPCNKRRRHSSSSGHTSAVAQSQSIHLLTPSSPSPQPSQTLDSLLQSQPHPPPPPSLIPGPAGAVQSAMLRKNLDRQSFSSQEQPIATQEYIRRAIEDAEEDEDFQRDPWISAIEFLTADGTENGVIPATPLNTVKKIVNIGRVDQVVAVIKSCTPNGLGDVMVTLKDPTGTVGGSIHRKVFSESEFGKNISVGSVLILEKVAVFAPSRSAHYLNITLNNVLKVFHKDGGPPLQQNDSPAACAVKYAAPATDQIAETRISGKEYPQVLERTEDAMNGIRTSGITRENSLDNNHQEKRNPFLGSIYSSNESGINITQNVTMGKESLSGRQSRAKEIFNEAVSMMEMSEKECRGSENNENLSDGGNLSEGQNVVRNCSKEVEEDMRIDLVQKQKEAQIIKSGSLPQWTDEQLNELFAPDCQDDDWV